MTDVVSVKKQGLENGRYPLNIKKVQQSHPDTHQFLLFLLTLTNISSFLTMRSYQLVPLYTIGHDLYMRSSHSHTLYLQPCGDAQDGEGAPPQPRLRRDQSDVHFRLHSTLPCILLQARREYLQPHCL